MMKYLLLLILVGSVSATDICVSKGFSNTVSVWNYTGIYVESFGDGVNVVGDARRLNWTSDVLIDGVVYKSGTRTYITDGGYNGKIPKTTLSNDIVYVAFCSSNEVPEFGIIACVVAIIGAIGVFLYKRK